MSVWWRAHPIHRLETPLRRRWRRWLLWIVLFCVLFASASFRVDQSAVSVATDQKSSRSSLLLSSPSSSSSSSSSSFFVPNPHRQLGWGMQLACSWKTHYSMTKDEIRTLVGKKAAARIQSSSLSWKRNNTNNTNNVTTHSNSSSISSSNSSSHNDVVQAQALHEGVCLPIDNRVRDRIHLYSSHEAQGCLANKTLLVTGDDYSMELFVGLTDILLNNPSDSTPTSSQQRSLLTVTKSLEESAEQTATGNGSMMPHLEWICPSDCDGRSPNWKRDCSKCLQQTTKRFRKQDTILIVGPVWELYKTLVSTTTTTKELILFNQGLLQAGHDVVFVSVSPNKTYTDPLRCGNYRIGPSSQYWAMLPWIQKRSVPHVDVFQATRSCTWKNCSAGAGLFRARFVNRWKAQLLLNLLCQHNDDDTTVQSDTNKTVSSSNTSVYPTRVDLLLAEKRYGETNRASSSARQNESGAVAPSLGHPFPKRVEFVPFPHNSLAVGTRATCQWRAMAAKSDPEVESLLGGDSQTPDLIQVKALEEGVCFSNDDDDNVSRQKLHLFSTQQAKDCLSNITLALGGDSYMRNLFIGLGETLFGNPTNNLVPDGSFRNSVLRGTSQDLREARDGKHRARGDFPDVRWICHDECYGPKQPFWKLCSHCIQEFKANHKGKPLVTFIGASVHVHSYYNCSATKTLVELRKLFNATEKLIFTSVPYYQIEKVPAHYKNATKGRDVIHWTLVDELNAFRSMRYIDFFALTKACLWDNCTIDGGHRARFVNRWKVQLMLNTLCSYSNNK